jgi:AbiTii
MNGASEPSRRQAALALAEELLGNIELGELPPVALVRKASRLARLLDDEEALGWLRYEISGYPMTGLDRDAWAAAERSNRIMRRDDGNPGAHTLSIGQMHADVQAGLAQIAASTATGSVMERNNVRGTVALYQGLLDKVIGALHEYVAARYQELRFGAAIETAFEVVRREVDSTISELVPDALPKLSAAFESVTSSNPEHWANATSTCRRLLRAVADALRPPGPPVDGRQMGAEQYINRLVDWIVDQAESETMAAMIRSDLEYLGQRLDAVQGAGSKGAHAEVDRFAASRFITGTYLLLGDILRLRTPAKATGEIAESMTDPALTAIQSAEDQPSGLAAKPTS